MRSLFNLLLWTAGFIASLAPAAEPALRVGMELGYPPFEMRDAKGEPAGISVDLPTPATPEAVYWALERARGGDSWSG